MVLDVFDSLTKGVCIRQIFVEYF